MLKAEYYRLKAETSEKIAALSTKLDAATERLESYERLEQELDSTVLAVGATPLRVDEARTTDAGAMAAATSGGPATAEAGALQPYVRVPSSAQRRMEQCLGLAKELMQAQRRAQTAEEASAERGREVARLERVVGDLERRARSSGHPQQYLAEQAEMAEKGRLEAEASATRLQQQLAEHADALAAARQQNDLLVRDLETLLSQRGSLDALRATLTRLLPSELAPAIAA